MNTLKYAVFILALAFSASCHSDHKVEKLQTLKAIGQGADSIVPREQSLLAFSGKYYDLMLTNDPQFCNLDSIVEGDCNSGYLYFTPKGNVIYHYLCVGATEEEYCIGKATQNKQGISILFDKTYAYSFSDDITGPTLKEINSGKLEQDTFSMQLKPLNCTGKYGYTIRQEDKSFDHYLIRQSRSDGINDRITDELQKIKALKQF